MSLRRRSRGKPRDWAPIALAAYLLVVLAVLVLPVGYGGIVIAIGDWLRTDLSVGWFGYGWIEFAANVAMFAPLGLLLTLLLGQPWRGVLLALALSASAELVQIVVPSRQASLRDIVANVLGAAIGAAIAGILLSKRERARRPRAGGPRLAS